MKFKIAWYWRNAWIGVRYSKNRHSLYFNLIPFLSLVLELDRSEAITEEIEYLGDFDEEAAPGPEWHER